MNGLHDRDNERGSAMILAVFTLALTSAIGIALLFLSQTEVKMSQASLRHSKAFYLAEAGAHHGLTALNAGVTLDTASGTDKNINVNLDQIRAVYNDVGEISGFTGYGDDVPLAMSTSFGDGAYVALLTNDPVDGRTNTTDSNDRVMVLAVGVLPDGSLESVETVVERNMIIPEVPPATITVLGPNPTFNGGGDRMVLDGEDCGGLGTPGLYMPVIGAIGAEGESNLEAGMCGKEDKCKDVQYISGPYSGTDTLVDLTDPVNEPLVHGTMAPIWTDCVALGQMIEKIRGMADFVCETGSCTLPPTTTSSVTFWDGDLTLKEYGVGGGLLVVTGKLASKGYNHWHGLVLVIGEGISEPGDEDNLYSGSIVVADIAGPDNVYGTADDCNNGDPNGFQPAVVTTTYEDNTYQYCTNDMLDAIPTSPFTVASFRQH